MRPRCCPAVLILLAVVMMGGAWADFDVNAVAGTLTLDDGPVPSGTIINITDVDKALSVAVPVDGPEVPPFLWGVGRFDTGDVPSFETGDSVVVEAMIGTLSARTEVELQAGTTKVELRIGGEKDGGGGLGELTEQRSDIGVGRSSPALLDWAGQIMAGLDRSFRMIGSIASETLHLLGFLAVVVLAGAFAMLGAALLVRRSLGAPASSVGREKGRAQR